MQTTHDDELAIQVRGLVKSYGATEAVQGVDFDVRRGEVFCLLGPNGAGKTSITEILEGYRARSAGTVSVLGHDPERGEDSFRQRIGIVLQETGVQKELSVRELLEMYGGYYPRRRPVHEVVELVGLEEKIGARVETLSGGQRRRLDLALALIGDPELIFLDEPTTGFDPAARRQAWSTIRDLSRGGHTIFLTTHFMDEAQFLADRVAVVAQGRIVASGTPESLGGRDRAWTRISFQVPQGLDLTLPPLGAAEITTEDDRVLIETPEGLAASHAITGWALERSLELRNFTVSQPSLEDTYLALVGDATPSSASIEVAR
jgi:ABC-2 type transport system ATP-binding protein